MRILIIKTSSLGDVVHMFPAVSDIHARYPSTTIDWVVEEAFAELPGWHPAVHDVIPVALRRWKHSLVRRKTWSEVSNGIAELKKRNYDIVIDAQGLLKSALIARRASGMHWGYDRHSIRESLASLFYQRKASVSRSLHAITRNRILCSQALDYDLTKLPLNYGLTLNFGIELPVGVKTPFIMAFHGTSRADKEWPEQYWVTFAVAMRRQQIQVLMPWGNQVEKGRAERVAACSDNIVVLPRITLTDIAALVQNSRGVIGMDTGLIHAAAALRKPVLALYQSTLPELTGALVQEGGGDVVNLSAGEVEDVDAVVQRFLQMI